MTTPSAIDYELYGLDPHSGCSSDFCLATRKPGPCVGYHRPGTVLAHPLPGQRNLPTIPNAPSDADVQHASAPYQQAMMNAQRLAQQLGAHGGQRSAAAHSAMQAYGQALHRHYQAAVAEQRAQVAAGRQYDTVAARNQAIATHAAAQAKTQAARQAAHAAAQKLAKHAPAKRSKPAVAQATNAALTAQLTRTRLAAQAAKGHYSLDEASAYSLYALPGEVYGLLSFEHQGCEEGEFCRNPLHPGPCKGWKHMLHSVAPGAYHAYEQQRVAKLNETRKARIKALQDAGHAVPKHLLKEITYAQVPKKPEGVAFVAPSPKEAEKALPATAKEIANKIVMKHAAINAAKVGLQVQAAKNMTNALGMTTSPEMEAKFKAASAKLGPHEKLSSHPAIHHGVETIASKVVTNTPELKPEDKPAVVKEIADHIDNAHEGLPPSVEKAAANIKAKASGPAELKTAEKQGDKAAQDAEKLATPAKAGAPVFVQEIGLGAPHSEIMHSLSQPGAKAEFDNLDPEHQKMVKDYLAQNYQKTPAAIDVVIHKIGLNPVDIKFPEPTPPLPPKPPADPAPHVAKAHMLATGQVSGTSKTKAAAYDKLSKAEFDALPPAAQSKISKDLVEAHGKFLDPKKKAQVEATMAKLMPGGEQAEADGKLPEPKTGNATAGEVFAKLVSSPFGKDDHAKEQAAIKAIDQHFHADQDQTHQGYKVVAQGYAEKALANLPGGSPFTSSEQTTLKKAAADQIIEAMKAGDMSKATIFPALKVLQPGSGASTEDRQKALEDLLAVTHPPKVEKPAGKMSPGEVYHQFWQKIMGHPPASTKAAVDDYVAKGSMSHVGLGELIGGKIHDKMPPGLPQPTVDALVKHSEQQAAKAFEAGDINQAPDVLAMAHLLNNPNASDEQKTAVLKELAKQINPAGAGGSSLANPAPPKLSAQQLATNYHAGYKAAAILGGGQGNKTKPEDFQKAIETGTGDQFLAKTAQGVASFWGKSKLGAYTDAQKPKIQAKAAEEIKQMMQTGATLPPSGGVLDEIEHGQAVANPNVLKMAGLPVPPPPKAGLVNFGVASPKAPKLQHDPHQAGLQQVVSTTYAAKVAKFNQMMSSAKKGNAALDSAPLSVEKMALGQTPAKMGTVTRSAARASLDAYSGTSYGDINGYLRAKAKGKTPHAPSTEKHVANIDAAFKNSKLPEPVVVYRGIKTGKKTFGDAFSEDKSMVGATITSAGYSSTSTSRGTAIAFAGYGGKGMILRYVLPAGTPAISLVGGQHSGEDELLLPHGMTLRVIADNGYQDGFRLLDLEVVKA